MDREHGTEERRLSAISTRWSLIFQAHEEGSNKPVAQMELVQRYHGAIYFYLLGVLRDPNVVEELCQEFAYRVVRGDFEKANPWRGRFRDYLKTSLFHLVADYRRKQRGQPRSLPPDSQILLGAEASDPDEPFLERWREELLNRTWDALAEVDKKTGQCHHTVLRLRAEQPDLTSEQMAAELSRRLQKDLNAAAARQALRRARQRFAELLVEEVAQSLQTTDRAAVDQELIDLQLYSYCKPAWPGSEKNI